MKIAVSGHTYLLNVNQKKWLVLADTGPDVKVLLLVPDGWRDPEFGNVPVESPPHPHVARVEDERPLDTKIYVSDKTLDGRPQLSPAMESHACCAGLRVTSPRCVPLHLSG